MNKEKAQKVLEAVLLKDYDQLRELNIIAFGNSGRQQMQTACIPALDDVKGICNPRLSHNYCVVDDIGCPKCLKALIVLATA